MDLPIARSGTPLYTWQHAAGTPAPVLSIGSAVPTNRSTDLRSVCPAITIGHTVGAGHFNQLEVPDQVNAIIEQFLAIKHLTLRG